MKPHTKNIVGEENANNNQARYHRGIKKSGKMSKKTNKEELVTLLENPQKSDVERPVKDSEEKQ